VGVESESLFPKGQLADFYFFSMVPYRGEPLLTQRPFKYAAAPVQIAFFFFLPGGFFLFLFSAAWQ